jgi:methylenetetrahydrofolate--tRNA-(uracil-5-)-methyltransferase
VDLNIAYRGSRYGRGIQELGDYINCPMNEDEYNEFVTALTQAERIKLREFDLSLEGGVNAGAQRFFEGCLPVEILARRDPKALAFGPLRPVGLRDPRTGRRPYAVVQLRQDNLAGSIYNLVGFQTNLKFSEQRRVFRMIPGLENAEFLRYGQMHRNTFVQSPDLLLPTMQHKSRLDLFFAGQITGVEGYAGNIACGLLAGINAARMIRELPLLVLPKTTMIGALMHYVTHAAAADFQPMKANFGIFPALSPKKRMNKKQRAAAYSQRALTDLRQYMTTKMIETH